MISPSYRIETLPQRGKQIVALEISSWLLVWLWIEDFGCLSKLCVVLLFVVFTASYIFSHITCFDGQAALVPLSLPTWMAAGWHITTQTYPYSGCQWCPLLALQSHGPLFGMLLCLFEKKKKNNKKRESLHPSWKQCLFPFRNWNGDFTAHLWLMNDRSQCHAVRQFLKNSKQLQPFFFF